MVKGQHQAVTAIQRPVGFELIMIRFHLIFARYSPFAHKGRQAVKLHHRWVTLRVHVGGLLPFPVTRKGGSPFTLRLSRRTTLLKRGFLAYTVMPASSVLTNQISTLTLRDTHSVLRRFKLSYNAHKTQLSSLLNRPEHFPRDHLWMERGTVERQELI